MSGEAPRVRVVSHACVGALPSPVLGQTLEARAVRISGSGRIVWIIKRRPFEGVNLWQGYATEDEAHALVEDAEKNRTDGVVAIPLGSKDGLFLFVVTGKGRQRRIRAASAGDAMTQWRHAERQMEEEGKKRAATQEARRARRPKPAQAPTPPPGNTDTAPRRTAPEDRAFWAKTIADIHRDLGIARRAGRTVQVCELTRLLILARERYDACESKRRE